MLNFPVPYKTREFLPNFSFPSKTRQAFPDFRSAIIKKISEEISILGLKCVIDHTKVDSDLTHFPIPVKLTSDHDFIFDVLGDDYLKLKIFKSDQTTALYCEVENWAVSWGPA